MKKKIKISFFGVGFMSQIAHLVNYFKNKNVELFEICDLDENLANNVKKKFNFTGKTVSDFKKMSINETDGVVIIVQRKLISPIVKYFLSRNCNVFSEKPHAYSVKEYLNNKKYQKKLWLKGFTRRHDHAVKYLKKNFKKINNQLGKLNTVMHNASVGNSYLGAKHYVKPFIKKEIKSKISKFPSFLPKKYFKLYDAHINSAIHSVDLFDFFKLNINKIFYSEISNKSFLCTFNCTYLKSNANITAQIFLSSSPNKLWDEKTIFYFERGQVTIEYNSPLLKKKSHKIIIFDKSKNKKVSILFKNKWSFDEQVKDFVNLIKKKQYKNINSQDGLEAIKDFENIWKFYLKKKKN